MCKYLSFGLQFEYFVLIENVQFQNGGAAVVHMYQSEIDALSKDQMDELVEEFFQLTFSEDDDGNAFHVMGIVHDAAAYLPDLLEHMAENYSTLTVKAGVMGRSSDIETLTMNQYNEQVNVDVIKTHIFFLFDSIDSIFSNCLPGGEKLFTWNVSIRTAASNQFGWQGARRSRRLFSRSFRKIGRESIFEKG